MLFHGVLSGVVDDVLGIVNPTFVDGVVCDPISMTVYRYIVSYIWS